MTNNPIPETAPTIAHDYEASKFDDSDIKMFTIDEEIFLSPAPPEVPSTRRNRHFYENSATYCSEEDINEDPFDRFGDCCDRDTDESGQQVETYILDVRNINAYSLDTRNRKGFKL